MGVMAGGWTDVEPRAAAGRAGWRAGVGRLGLFAAGLMLGGILSLLASERRSAAHLFTWLGQASTKDADRLAATAESSEARAISGTCTALVLDRFTGLTAALACSEAPAMPSPLALRRGEIES